MLSAKVELARGHEGTRSETVPLPLETTVRGDYHAVALAKFHILVRTELVQFIVEYDFGSLHPSNTNGKN